MRHTPSINRTLRHFSFKQTVRGGVVLGLIIGIMMGAQGPAYQSAYPKQAERDMFVKTLDTTPALGFLSGETINASQPASYSIYKSITIVTLATGIWSILVVTRMLRSQEEDGRMELLLVGATTKLKTTCQLLLGVLQSLGLSMLIAFICIAVMGRAPHVALTAGSAALITLATYLPALFFGALAVLTSQLARSRSRAVGYALVPLLLLFTLRGIANSIVDLDWLKHLTPFGWSDLLNPVLHPHIVWIFPTLFFVIPFLWLGFLFAASRDLDAGIIGESDAVRSRLYLLGSSTSQALRDQRWSFTWWAIGTFAFVAMLVSLANVGAHIISNASGSEVSLLKSAAPNGSIAVAFIGMANIFVSMILLIMTTILVARFRHTELRGYLDNLLVGPVSRTRWLTGRIALIIGMLLLVDFGSVLITWYLAAIVQHLTAIHFHTMLGVACSPLALSVFILGIGALVYGTLPRATVLIMSAIIAWSYVIDTFKTLTGLPGWLEKTSLLHYLAISPTITPDTKAIVILVVTGCLAAVIGTVGFSRRDIISE